jgi:monovalent cation:H+ antiporter-2, CPA2 family
MHATPLLTLVILLAAAVIIVAVFRALKLNPVLGYLVAGAAIGPHGMGYIENAHDTAAIAEFGIVLLLFLIGLELSWDRLHAMRKKVFGIGSAQMVLTMAVFMALTLALGFGWPASIIIGGGLALSSTALVLQVLQERGEMASQTGRLSLAILILQDLAVLPLLVLVPLLASPHDSMWLAIGTGIGQAALALMAIAVVGRLLIRPLFRVIAKLDIHELFVATTLLVVLSASWAAHEAGLSMALGAFLAGLLVAETEFHHQIEADVKPYKGLLMGLFFMSVGMMINLEFIVENTGFVLLAALAFITLKAAILYGVLRGFGYGIRTSGHTALLLSQGGEFGFILFGLAASVGLLAHEIANLLLLVIALTMAITPILERIGERFERRWQRARRPSVADAAQEALDLDSHIVIAGYGSMGEMLAGMLARESQSFIATDLDPARVWHGRKHKHPVYFGDASRPDVLHAIGISRARAVIVTFRDAAHAITTVRALRSRFPNIPIIARAAEEAHAHGLIAAGATEAIPELKTSTMRILARLLTTLEWPEAEIARVMRDMRDA